ncbi:hypothetical protein [Sphingobacterium mizutaii]|uniref:hypothetical protein n=2 Tax=Sphingobacterium mizutaii TaxID=1010 RepID=UPI00111438A3|nr:hypothetical protein [Sphingobacterium mizutaii]
MAYNPSNQVNNYGVILTQEGSQNHTNHFALAYSPSNQVNNYGVILTQEGSLNHTNHFALTYRSFKPS